MAKHFVALAASYSSSDCVSLTSIHIVQEAQTVDSLDACDRKLSDGIEHKANL